MPFYISPKTFKQQVKLVIKHYPFPQTATTSHIRDVLSQVYGYRNDHHYHKLIAQDCPTLTPCSKQAVIQHYPLWVQRLAKLAPMNEIQAKKLIFQLWIAYLKDQINTADKLYHCTFEFFGDCQVFLDDSLRGQSVAYAFDDKPSVKDAIEAIGIPHTEVLAIQVNKRGSNKFVDFQYKISHDDHIQVYSTPDFFQLNDLLPEQRLPYRPEKLTFLLDVHLGGLARYLRMAGFDCLFDSKDYGDAFLAEFSHNQELILLTRDIGLLKRGKVKYGRWIRNVLPEQQFHEVVQHYQLVNQFRPFSVCIKCNGAIHPVATKQVSHLVPTGVLEQNLAFKQCQSCQQVYWQGSHYQKIQAILTNAQAVNGVKNAN